MQLAESVRQDVVGHAKRHSGWLRLWSSPSLERAQMRRCRRRRLNGDLQTKKQLDAACNGDISSLEELLSLLTRACTLRF